MSILKITPGRNNIRVYQGDTVDEILQFKTKTTANGVVTKTPINIATWSFEAQATNGTLTTNGTCTVLDAANGILRVTYPLSVSGNVTCMSHAITATVAGVRRTYAGGSLTVQSRSPECCDA